MCMITYLPPFVKVPAIGIENGGTWNDDGHGWAVAGEPGLMLTGHYMDLEYALDTFIAAREAFPHAPALFHSRWATHGEKTVKNVHPFYVGSKDVVVAHNGILPAAFHPTKNDTRSDTAIMADEWLRKQSSGRWTKKERRRVGALIGSGNKLAILSTDSRLDKPRGYLVNAQAGVWDKGAWYSNHDYATHWTRGKGIWTSEKEVTTIGFNYQSPKECGWCGEVGHVDPETNVCLFCLTCLDCWVHLDDCLCHYEGREKQRPARNNWDDDEENPDQTPGMSLGEAYRALEASSRDLAERPEGGWLA